MKKIVFGETAAKRIVAATRRVEQSQRNTPAGRRRPKTPQKERTRFRLTAVLTTGGSAAAVRLFYADGAWNTTGDTLTVYDPFSMFTGSIGSMGYATIWRDSAKWEIDSIQC